MAALPLLLRGIPMLRLRLCGYHLSAGISPFIRRPWCTSAESAAPQENVSSGDKGFPSFTKKEDPKNLRLDDAKSPRWDDPDYRKWKDKEDEILGDIEPITSLAKEIIHSDRYMDGERLSVEDEKVIVEKLLKYHPHAEDKIGCGLDSIMVDRHPQFKHSRCLFVVRTDGLWIDFSYQKCLRAYVREKYPLHAERFIREHFKRGSG